jgi:SAM-dependent methyltransferase
MASPPSYRDNRSASRDPTALRVARSRPARPLHERLVKTFDEEIVPVWNDRFEALVKGGLPQPVTGAVLELGCGTGTLTTELLRRHQGAGRIVSIDPSAALVDEARMRLGDSITGKLSGKVFLRVQEKRPKLPFAEETFDLVVSHPGPADARSSGVEWETQLIELVRVLAPGGTLMVTRALRDSFGEVLDLLDEVLLKLGDEARRQRLRAHRNAQPDGPALAAAAERMGLTDVQVTVDRWELLFRSGRELFYAPVIEQGPLPAWKAIVTPPTGTPGDDAGATPEKRQQEVQAVFSVLKDTMDTYTAGQAFALTVAGARLTGRKPAQPEAVKPE